MLKTSIQKTFRMITSPTLKALRTACLLLRVRNFLKNHEKVPGFWTRVRVNGTFREIFWSRQLSDWVYIYEIVEPQLKFFWETLLVVFVKNLNVFRIFREFRTRLKAILKKGRVDLVTPSTLYSEVYLEPSRTPTMKLFCENS